MINEVYLRYHGTGNAWPVPLGSEHPFYDRTDFVQLANAAYSIIVTCDDEEIEVLLDAGHGIVQSLLANSNKIPDALCLTHGHLDHVASVDWIVQSYVKQHEHPNAYPVYSTLPVYSALIRSFPHLEGLIDFHELIPGVAQNITNLLRVTSFPVFHGEHSRGASMILVEAGNRRVLFTGDLLTPILRSKDYDTLSHIDLVISDANNRFPYPKSNHWSIDESPDQKKISELFPEYYDRLMLKSYLTAPHQRTRFHLSYHRYFEEFLATPLHFQCFTVFDFIRSIEPKSVHLVHYSGSEDEKHYKKPRLSPSELKSWVDERSALLKPAPVITLPGPGDTLPI